MSWEKVAIEDLCIKVTSGGTPLRSTTEFYDGGTIPWIKTKEVNFNRIYDADEKITEKGLDNSSAKLIPENSILIAMYGDGHTAGRCAINRLPVTTNQACCNLVIDSEKANPDYMFYKISTLYEIFRGLKSGGSQQNLNAKTLREFKLQIPPLPTQRKIATILSAYDDLIENNLKRIKLLEEAININFKNLISTEDKNFTNEKLNSFVDIISGFPFKSNYYNENGKHKIVTIKNVQDGFFVPIVTDKIDEIPDRMNEDLFLNTGDVIMSLTGNVGRVCLVYGENYVLNQRVVKLLAKDKNDLGFVYALLRDKQMQTVLENLSNGTAQQNLSPIKMGELFIKYPSEKSRKVFNEIALPMIDLICKINLQNTKLREARDILLPKLMNGQI